jgi:hypothetical protein
VKDVEFLAAASRPALELTQPFLLGEASIQRDLATESKSELKFDFEIVICLKAEIFLQELHDETYVNTKNFTDYIKTSCRYSHMTFLLAQKECTCA